MSGCAVDIMISERQGFSIDVISHERIPSTSADCIAWLDNYEQLEDEPFFPHIHCTHYCQFVLIKIWVHNINICGTKVSQLKNILQSFLRGEFILFSA